MSVSFFEHPQDRNAIPGFPSIVRLNARLIEIKGWRSEDSEDLTSVTCETVDDIIDGMQELRSLLDCGQASPLPTKEQREAILETWHRGLTVIDMVWTRQAMMELEDSRNNSRYIQHTTEYDREEVERLLSELRNHHTFLVSLIQAGLCSTDEKTKLQDVLMEACDYFHELMMERMLRTDAESEDEIDEEGEEDEVSLSNQCVQELVSQGLVSAGPLQNADIANDPDDAGLRDNNINVYPDATGLPLSRENPIDPYGISYPRPLLHVPALPESPILPRDRGLQPLNSSLFQNEFTNQLSNEADYYGNIIENRIRAVEEICRRASSEDTEIDDEDRATYLRQIFEEDCYEDHTNSDTETEDDRAVAAAQSLHRTRSFNEEASAYEDRSFYESTTMFGFDT